MGLLRAGLVRARREGTRVYYCLASEHVGALWRAMRDVAAQHVFAVDHLSATYLGDRSELATMSHAELLDRLSAGDVVVLDVRPPAEYAAGHLPRAVNVPPDELEERLRDFLPTSRSWRTAAGCCAPTPTQPCGC